MHVTVQIMLNCSQQHCCSSHPTQSVFILGSGPYNSSRLAGKANATLYYPEVLNQNQISTVCGTLLEENNRELSGYCLPKNQ